MKEHNLEQGLKTTDLSDIKPTITDVRLGRNCSTKYHVQMTCTALVKGQGSRSRNAVKPGRKYAITDERTSGWWCMAMELIVTYRGLLSEVQWWRSHARSTYCCQSACDVRAQTCDWNDVETWYFSKSNLRYCVCELKRFKRRRHQTSRSPDIMCAVTERDVVSTKYQTVNSAERVELKAKRT